MFQYQKDKLFEKIYLIALLIFFSTTTFASLQKTVVQVDAGNTKLVGEVFIYRLSYSCDNISGDCLNAQVIDQLPSEVEYVSHVITSDVNNVSVVGNLITFNMESPLTAGNSGDLLINVRFPNGSTPNAAVATNTADGINLETTPGTFTTPPVVVTAIANLNVNLTKTILSSDTFLDMPIDYRLRISNSGSTGSLNLAAVTVADTLESGVIFNGASPVADCEPACIGAVAPALLWSGPFNINAGNNLDITVTVTYPTPTFSDGQMVTNEFTADGTPLGEGPVNLGIGTVTHAVTPFVADPSLSFSKSNSAPNPPTFNQTFYYFMRPRNDGNVDLENMVMIDTLPIEFSTISVSSGSYNANQAGSVNVEFQTNLNAYALLGTSVASTNTTFNIPSLAVGEYVTLLRWTFTGVSSIGMNRVNSPRVTGQIINPDNNGGVVNIGDVVQNCALLTAVYEPLGANQMVSENRCRNLTISGDFVQLNPNKVEISSGPYLPNETVSWELRAESHNNSSTNIDIENVVIADLLPADLIYVPASDAYNANGTGLPAPTLTVTDNFNNTGRTLLVWTWAIGSGQLQVNNQVRVTFDTLVREGAPFGNLNNVMSLTHNDPGLGLRCGSNSSGSGSSSSDIFDLDGDSSTSDRLCNNTNGANISPVAQLTSLKEVKGICDASFNTNSLGTIAGTTFDYRLTVQNEGTLTTQGFVFIDILPHIGDTGVLDTNPRSTQWDPILLAPITPPAGTVIYYSTSGNPCRPEVGGITSGCDIPNWSVVPPNPISTVKSFKVEFENNDVLSFDTLQFELTMFSAANTPNSGEMAFNSFAYQGFRADGLGSLNAEPNKVGMSIGGCPVLASLGDYVWLDSNSDGIQNDGNTGVNGVYVQLFSDGLDDIPNNADDVLIATTVTSDDIANVAGWYNFPTLTQDTYYTCFEVPAQYNITSQNTGVDDSIDSDVNPFTQCTDPVFLPNNTNNPDLDLGLIGPNAALGNYVWLDSNADGLQNESPFNGLNGVAVSLYADNGDGTADPGVDTLLQTIATADDLFGNPGFYHFVDLIPSVAYFVVFTPPSPALSFTNQNTGADDSIDSDANAVTGVSQIVTLTAGENNLTIDAGVIVVSGNLSLGNQVWFEDQANVIGVDNGIFDSQLGEPGINGVELDLYVDINANGLPDVNEYITTTNTSISNGFDGRYLFKDLAASDYIVVVKSSNFTSSGALFGYSTCTANDPVTDPDDNQNGDDDGAISGSLTYNLPITLSNGGEPITDGDNDNNSNLSVDFCFTEPALIAPPVFDYGDNPDTFAGESVSNYQTTVLDSGAVHLLNIPMAPYLGACVDADNGLVHDAGSIADDSTGSNTTVGTCVVNGDDEDGVVFSATLLHPGDNFSIDVTASSATNACMLDAWIDWNQNGQFELTEQIAASQNIASGSLITIALLAPININPGRVYSRFRCSSIGGLSANGPNPTNLLLVPDGEVEDYQITIIGQDLADAPDSYMTLIANNGPRHDVNPLNLPRLGSCVDLELDGQPNALAAGDDDSSGLSTIGLCFDDEDGILSFPILTELDTSYTIPMANVLIDNSSASIATLHAWLDFDGNGQFDADEYTSSVVNIGAIAPATDLLWSGAGVSGLNDGNTYARFRITSDISINANTPGGLALDGEVEDYLINIVVSEDWGDVPDSYGTLSTNNGAHHGLDINLYIGDCVDDETNGQATVSAQGDDNGLENAVVYGSCSATNDDEDSLVPPTLIENQSSPTIDLVTFNNTGTDATVACWIDYNGNGVFDNVTERGTNTVTNGTTSITVTMPDVPLTANFDTSGSTYMRCRIASNSADVDNATGLAVNGEVEDYIVTIDPVFTLGDYVWLDANKNGIQDLSESGVNGVTVTLYNDATCTLGNEVDSPVNTANGGMPLADGFYEFTDLLTGTYCIQFTNIPSGFEITPNGLGTTGTGSDADPSTARIENIVLTANDPDEDMGLVPLGSVSGLVWCESDTNTNSSYNLADGDTLQSNIGVTLYEDTDCSNGINGTEVTTAITQDTVLGLYSFSDLITGAGTSNPPGCYIVEVDITDTDLGICDNSITPIILTPDITTDNPDSLNNNFGHNEQLMLGDYVWYDANQNGVQEVGEPGINGVTVNLYTTADCSGPIALTTATVTNGNDGYYQFSPLASGMYCVEFLPPAGYTISPTGAGTVTTDSNADLNGQVQNIDLQDSDLSIDMGVFVLGSVSGLVWCESDTNPNTAYDVADADTLQSSVTVTLYEDTDCNDSLNGSEASTAIIQETIGGNYLFSNLITGGPGAGNNPPGCYLVEVDVTDPDLGVCDNPITATLMTPDIDAPNPDSPDNNFGMDEQLGLGDYVWYDSNQNGVQEAGEPGINGVTVNLYTTADCSGPIALTTATVTNGNDGYYRFSPLASGMYCVEFLPPAGYTISPTGAGTVTTDSNADLNGQVQNIDLQDSDLSIDMGVFVPGSVSGLVWCESDTNPNTAYDVADADTLQSNVTVTLYEDTDCNDSLNGSEASTAITQDTTGGNYLFSNLITGGAGAGNNPPGCYLVEVDTTDPDLGVCVNPITATLLTPDIDAPNPDSPDNNFGHDEQLSLGDYVWYDANQNGVQETGESGINGVIVNLYTTADCSGPIALTTATVTNGNDGYYRFSPLASGMYCVEFLPPAGYTISPTGAGTVTTDSNADLNGQVQNIDLQDSDLSIDMGVFVPGSVSGLVWCESDTNPNTTYDVADADTLQSNVTVTLYEDTDCNDSLNGSEASTAITQDTTGGNYLFSNLITGGPGAGNNPPGCYLVEVDTTDPDLGVCANPITATLMTPDIDAPNPDNPDNNFGHDEQLTLGDTVWYDNDLDGIQDSNEPGVNGISVDLYNTADCTGSIIQTTVTAPGGLPVSDGWYEFAPLASNDYCIEFSDLPTGWVFTQANQGTDEGLDSDVNPATGQIVNIDLQNNDPYEDVGIYAAIGTIPGNMFCDINPVNGVLDAGEEQPDLTIYLHRDTDCDGIGDILYGSLQTDINGEFEFVNVPVALVPTPPNPQACYVVNYDVQDSDLGDCTAPILPEENDIELTTDMPDGPRTIFGTTFPIPIMVPVNNLWGLLLFSILLLMFARRYKFKYSA